MARKKIVQRKFTQDELASDKPPAGLSAPERISWGQLKLRYLPMKDRIRFIKPDDEGP